MVSPPSSAGGYGPTKEAARITEWQPQSKNKRFSRKTILVSGVVATAVIIGLAIGLGVGLTTGGSSSDSDESETSPISTSTPIPTGDGTSGDIWQPVVRSTWQIVLQDPIDLSEDATSVEPDVDVYDIDLFTNDKATIDTLHRLGKRVICYFSAGSYEPYRPDSSDFRSADKGQVMDGWEDENWLDINSENVRSIMAARIELARDKGCDGIDPDNVDGYNNENGLGLTQQDTVNYLRHLSRLSITANLALGLKNAAEIVPQVEPLLQFAVNEQCIEYRECASFKPFTDNGKPVFQVEYPDEAARASSGNSRVRAEVSERICADEGDAEGSGEFSKVIKGLDLGGWVEFCDGEVARTPVLDR